MFMYQNLIRVIVLIFIILISLEFTILSLVKMPQFPTKITTLSLITYIMRVALPFLIIPLCLLVLLVIESGLIFPIVMTYQIYLFALPFLFLLAIFLFLRLYALSF